MLVFKVIEATFLTSIKAVDQKSTEMAVSRDQVFHNTNVHEKKKDILYDCGAYAAYAAYERWGGGGGNILKQMNEGCRKTHYCWDFHCNDGISLS